MDVTQALTEAVELLNEDDPQSREARAAEIIRSANLALTESDTQHLTKTELVQISLVLSQHADKYGEISDDLYQLSTKTREMADRA